MIGKAWSALRNIAPKLNTSTPRGKTKIRISAPIAYEPEADVNELFWRMVGDNPPKRVLEVGTLQAVRGRSTHSRNRFLHLADSDYIRADMVDGPDVDVVCDLHQLPAEWSNRFDCFIANAVFEHLERPWVAAREVARSLAPGGLFLVVTHQCFPLHGYPQDFFRFSREALRLIFEDAGLVVEAADYQHRCTIVPPESVVPLAGLDAWNATFPSYILVGATGRKSG